MGKTSDSQPWQATQLSKRFRRWPTHVETYPVPVHVIYSSFNFASQPIFFSSPLAPFPLHKYAAHTSFRRNVYVCLFSFSADMNIGFVDQVTIFRRLEISAFKTCSFRSHLSGLRTTSVDEHSRIGWSGAKLIGFINA